MEEIVHIKIRVAVEVFNRKYLSNSIDNVYYTTLKLVRLFYSEKLVS